MPQALRVCFWCLNARLTPVTCLRGIIIGHIKCDILGPLYWQGFSEIAGRHDFYTPSTGAFIHRRAYWHLCKLSFLSHFSKLRSSNGSIGKYITTPITELIKWSSEQGNGWSVGWASGWVNEWSSKLTSDQAIAWGVRWVNMWVSEWVIVWAKVSEWIDEWVGEWVRCLHER